MTQEEAVIKVLLDMGGRATLKQLYKLVPKYANFGTKTPDASIRCIIYKNKDLISDKNNPGWVEHVSYKENKINQLETEIINKDLIIKELEEEKKRNVKELEEEKNKECISTEWIINYAKERPENKEGARVIKDMLNYFCLYSNKSSGTGSLEMLREINNIPDEYAKRHPLQPVVGSAAQVVVSNSGEVKYYRKEDGKE